MTIEDRIWFNPPKFWAATANLSQDEADRFMERVIEMAESRNIEELRKFDFIGFGAEYLKRRAYNPETGILKR